MALRLAVLDLLAVFAAVCGIVLSAPGPHPVPWPSPGTAGPAALLAVCTVIAFYYSDLYDVRLARRLGWSARRMGIVWGWVVAVASASEASAARSLVAALPLVGGLFAAFLALVGLRAAAFGWLARPARVKRVLVIGDGAMARQLVAAIEARRDGRLRVVGVVGEDGLAASPHLGRGTHLRRMVDEVRPDRVIVALASRRGRMPFRTLLDLRLRGIGVEDGVDTFERLTGRIAIEALTPSSLIFTKESPSRRVDLALTWAMSVSVAAIGLVVLAPLLALIALAIRLDSRGPVFFVHPRVGRGGRLFNLIKFRTMRPASGRTSEWARDNQNRVTRVGRWLRRFRLDELPQFVNVVKGDMNLVGPRPHPMSNLPLLVLVARNTPECGEQIPFYALRSVVRPGITGWAQVRYRYANDLEEEIEKMRYDLYYVKHRSLWLDLRILLETVRIVMGGRESATTSEVAPLSTATARSLAASSRAGAVPPSPAATPVPITTLPITAPDTQPARA
jgi:exopolysaccharide biosynthesis polyprenyl glycosylphosphotransferase